MKTNRGRELFGIDHVIVVMMENRSFDHLLGWRPNAEGRQAGLTYLDPDGAAHEPPMTTAGRSV
jgi:phospholipase C